VIITTDAAGPAARLHDRMPEVLADADMMWAWHSPDVQLDDVPDLLRAARRRPNHSSPAESLGDQRPNDGPELLEPTIA
jgi:putative SOS response-associated peptidase YedK